MKCFCGFLLPILYLAIAFLTFAWIQETPLSEQEAAFQKQCPTCRHDGRDFASLLGGIFWPIYWSGHGALTVVRYAKTQPSALICKDMVGNTWKPTDGICMVQSR